MIAAVMGRLHRYVLVQILVAAFGVAAALSCAVWLAQSLRFIDWIVNRGLPVTTFVAVSALMLPSFLAVILPIGLFSATLFIVSRLAGDSEINVMRACGMSPARMGAPAMSAAVVIAGLCYVVNLWMLPASYREFKDLQWRIRNDFSNVLIQEGVFSPLSNGMTLFVREQQSDNALIGVLVHDEKQVGKPVTMIAERGFLAQGPDGPRIVLRAGVRQELNRQNGRISYLFFDEYAVDVAKATAETMDRQRDATERYLGELFNPEDGVDERSRAKFRVEGHQRLAGPLYCFAFALIALASLLAGDFSRRGQGRRAMIAVGGAAATQAMGFALADLAVKNTGMTLLVYGVPLSAAFLAGWTLLKGRLPWARGPRPARPLPPAPPLAPSSSSSAPPPPAPAAA